MTRPLAAVTDGDARRGGDRRPDAQGHACTSRAWDDEDARLLGGAFNTLTESIARFQREAAQRERLSSLGRLSTVIAHEIRNPLMIIRASLSTPARDRGHGARACAKRSPTSTRRRTGSTASSPRCSTSPSRSASTWPRPDLNDVCRASAAAAWAGDASGRRARSISIPALPPVVTDAERLRTALVNILANARHAVRGVARRDPARRTLGRAARRRQDRAGRRTRVVITISRPRRRHRARGHGAHLRPVLHDAPRRHRPRACRSRRTSSRAWAARIVGARASRGEGTDVQHRPAAAAAGTRGMTRRPRRDPARRRRREDPQAPRPGAARRRPRGRRGRQRARGAAAARRAPVRPGGRRQPDAGHDRARAGARAGATHARQRAAADRADDGARLARRSCARRSSWASRTSSRSRSRWTSCWRWPGARSRASGCRPRSST